MTSPNDTELCKRLREDFGINLDWPASAKIAVIGMNCERYQAAAEIEALSARIGELEAGLERQADNMAFVLNRVDLHAWHGKFEQELASDRLLLRQARSLCSGETKHAKDNP